MSNKVTDPELLAELNGGKVTDPAILAELEGRAPAQPKREADSVLSRIGTGFADPIFGAAQIADKLLVNPVRQTFWPGSDSMQEVVKAREDLYEAPEGVDVARIAGSVANPATWIGPGKGQMLVKAAASRPVRAAAATGATQAVLAPTTEEDFWTEKAQQAGLGATGGAVLAKALRGFTPTKEAKALIDQGIQPSFGQSMGGIVNTVEQKLTSTPGIGDAAQWARQRPMKEWQERAVERVSLGSAKTLDEANAFAGKLYDEVVPHLKPTKDAVMGVNKAVQEARQNPELTFRRDIQSPAGVP
jgi:hypothetical protein